MFFRELTRWFFIFILTLITWFFFKILSPYFTVILWATILAIIFNPVKNKMCVILCLRNTLASLITLGIICLIVFVPLGVIFSLLAIELNTVYAKLAYSNTKFFEIIAIFFSHLPSWIQSCLIDRNLNNAVLIQKKFSELVLHSTQYLAGSVFLIGKKTFSFAVNFSIMLYLLFFLLKDGSTVAKTIFDSLPLSKYLKQQLFTKFVAVLNSTVKGTIVTAIIQGMLGGIAFYIVGIDGNILWVILITFLSLIPMIGPMIVWVPAAIYLFSSYHFWQGFFIIGFFVIIIGLVDNILRPLLVGKDTKIPDYLILITMLGGMKMYGINGFVSGPLVAALFITFWNLLFENNCINDIYEYSKDSSIKKNI